MANSVTDDAVIAGAIRHTAGVCDDRSSIAAHIHAKEFRPVSQPTS